jgi:phosphopantetheinyl transferase (holo-ACP synthase)
MEAHSPNVTLVADPVVRVIRVRLEPAHPAADAILPPEERTGSPAVRTARAAGRAVLAPLVGVEPAAVPVVRNCERCGHPTHGRPRVAGHDDVSFSVSHSADTALIAIATTGVTVGVDLEARRSRARLPELARRIMRPEQFDAWEPLAADAQLDEFFRVWTTKEAYLKAIGLGIVTRLADVPADPDGWHVAPITAPPGFVAALATDARVAVEYGEFDGFSANAGTAS